MKSTRPIAVVLVIAGLVALLIGGALLVAPASFHSSSGIDLGGDVNLLNETRAPGASLVAMGSLMLLGVVVERLRFVALVAAAVLYASYGVGRLASWAVDGTPHSTLVVATGVELAIAAAAGWALASSRLEVEARRP
ncbi:MAG: DUF4345 domain-containing protein [Acidimicrobiales bacterium]